jgi:hopanoid C-3 methylase
MIRPRPAEETIGLQHLMIVEPLELEVLGALVPPGDEVHIVDMILEKNDLFHFLGKINPDILCITGYITHLPVMTEYCRLAKKFSPSIVTVVGGIHIELFPEDIEDESVDYRIIRNATRAFPQLLEHLRDPEDHPFPGGIIGKNGAHARDLRPDFDFYFPAPRRELTRAYRKDYFYVFHDRVALMKTSFGCPYSCSFCFCRLITGTIYHTRPMEEVMAELESIREKEIYIVDDDFLVSPKRVAEFIELLKERRLDKRFLVYGRADFIINHPDLILAFRKVGLRTIIIGLESFFDEELENYDKRLKASANEKAMEILNRCGVDCYAAIILSPGYSKEDFSFLRRKIKDLKIKFLNLQPLTPLPGVNIPGDIGELILDRKDFARWDLAHVAIKPEKMGLAEYYQQILRIYSSVAFRPRNILSHMKYPLRLQWKLARGLFRLRRQYRHMYQEALSHA